MTRNRKTFSEKWVHCRVHADLTSFPVELDIVIPFRRSLPFFSFALFWTFASLLLLSEASNDGIGGTLFGLFFVVTGLFMLVHFSSLVGARQHIRLDEDGVSVRDTSWFRPARVWHKPYNEFEGVVMRQCQSSAENHTTYYQIIELLHADRQYIVPLYIHPEMGAPRKILKACSDRLSPPALKASSNTFASNTPFEG